MAPAPATPTGAVPTRVDEALNALFLLGARVLGARRCSLYLRADGGDGGDGDDADRHALRLRCGAGLTTDDDISTIETDGSIAGVVMHARVSLLVQDIATYSGLPAHPERYATPSFITVPVLVENDAYGIFNAADRHDGQAFTEDDLQSAELVARALSTVLHNDLLAQRVLDKGEVDPVTGLYNSRHLGRRLPQESLRAQRAGAPLTLLLLAADCYESVASRVGIQTAGVLVRCVGEMAAHAIRQSDILAVDEGSHIAVVLPATPLDKARQVARTIMREVRHEKLPAHLRYDCERLDLRIGIASLETYANGSDLLEGARMALRQARERGDAIVVAQGAKGTRRLSPRSRQATIALAHEHGVPSLADPAAAMTASAYGVIAAEVARSYACAPVAVEDGVLTLAMANPGDAAAIHAVSQATGLAIYPVAAPRAKIQAAIAALTPRVGEDVAKATFSSDTVACSHAE